MPGGEVVVEGDRVHDARVAHRLLDIFRHLLEGELGRVHADDLQPGGVVTVIPGVQVRLGAHAVDAAVRPEIDQHDLAPEVGQGGGVAVDPVRDTGQFRGLSELVLVGIARHTGDRVALGDESLFDGRERGKFVDGPRLERLVETRGHE